MLPGWTAFGRIVGGTIPGTVIFIWTAKKKNQPDQNPKAFDQLFNTVRERTEGAFNEVQNTGRNLERLLAKTILGLCTQVIAKMASHGLKLVLRCFYNIDVQTFEYLAVA